MRRHSGWLGWRGSSAVLCLTLALAGASRGAPARGQLPEQDWMTEENWEFAPDDYVAILVESPQQPPRQLLQSTITVWASRAGIMPGAPLEFHLVSRAVPTFRWSTKSYAKTDPALVRYPPPPSFYGPSAHLGPGIYFLSYARLQGDRHRLGLSDGKCGRAGRCSNEVLAPGGQRRYGVQIHAMFDDKEGFHEELSEGCLTTYRKHFARIFPDSFTSSATSPLFWNGTRHPKDPEQAKADEDRGLKFAGSGNVLVFVTDPLTPGWNRQSESFRRWQLEGRLSANVFAEGTALDLLRADWHRLAAAPGLETVAKEYEVALKEAARRASGGFRAERPEALFIEGKVVKGAELLSRDHRAALDLPGESLKAFEQKAWLGLAEALAGSDLDQEAMTSRIEELASGVTEVGQPPDPGWSTVVDVALALRIAGVREKVELEPALAAMAGYQRSLGEAVRKAEDRLRVGKEVVPILDQLHQAVAAMERAPAAPAVDSTEALLTAANTNLETVAKLQQAFALIESTTLSPAPKVADLEKAAGLLPKEIGDPMRKLAQAYSGISDIAAGASGEGDLESDLEMVRQGVNGLAEALDLKEDKTTKTVLTVVNVGLSIASGNYVGAAMALLGSGGSGGGGQGMAFAMLGKQLNALLEGQRKILEDLQKIKKAIQALEERMILQHQEVLDRLSDLDSGIRLTRRVALEGLYGDYQLCQSFYGRSETLDDAETVRAWQTLRRDFWGRCDAALNRLAGWDTISQAFLFRAASTDTADSKLERRPELAPGDSRRAESDLFLARVVEPMFIASQRQFQDHHDALVLTAGFYSTGTVDAGELRRAKLGDAFASTGTEILDRDFLLAPAEVIAFSRTVFLHARFWLSGGARGFPDRFESESYESQAQSEASHLLHAVLRLLNQAIAQQVLLGGEKLFEVDRGGDLQALPVTSDELDALLQASHMFPQGASNVAGFLLDRLLALDGKAGTYWSIAADPMWAERLGDVGTRHRESGLKTQDGRPVALTFGRDLCEKKEGAEGARLVGVRFPMGAKNSAPVCHVLALAGDEQSQGAAPGRVQYPGPLQALRETRAETLKLLALAQLAPLSREAVLSSN